MLKLGLFYQKKAE